jgi:hypothetical protein
MSPQTLTQASSLREAVESTGLNVLMLGIYVEHDRQLYGLEAAETQSYRLHADGELVRMGVSNKPRSHADDIEFLLHPLRKYVSLAAAGNPSVLSTLWSDTGSDLGVLTSPAAELLLAHRDAFVSKHAAFRHAGYARAQRDALLGLTNKRTNRPELSLVHGFDSKYASHLIRLLMAGLDLVRERTYHLPMKAEQTELLLEIRRGELTLDDVLTLAEKLERELMCETEDSSLPDSVDFGFLNDLLRQVRNEHLDR